MISPAKAFALVAEECPRNGDAKSHGTGDYVHGFKADHPKVMLCFPTKEVELPENFVPSSRQAVAWAASRHTGTLEKRVIGIDWSEVGAVGSD